MSNRHLADLGSPGPILPNGIASPELIASLLVDGDDELAAWAISQALQERRRAAVFDDVVRGAMELVGRRWEADQWTISEEHLATMALTATLARIRPGDEPGTRLGPVAVLAGPEGEHHVAGLACLAQVLEEDGWLVHNLGANVPADDLVRYLGSREVDLVGLTVATAPRVPALLRTVEALRPTPGGGGRPAILVGGRGVGSVAPTPEGVDFVAGSLSDAERFASIVAERRRSAAG